MGGYGECYVFAAQQWDNALAPLPLEGFHVRTPWVVETLRQTRQVVIEYGHTGFASSENLPKVMVQYGNTLRLADPNWYQNGEYAFALYSNEPQ